MTFQLFAGKQIFLSLAHEIFLENFMGPDTHENHPLFFMSSSRAEPGRHR
jgi:hypothetical protein